MDSAFSLDGQVALVTGGTVGLGRSIAIVLAEAGADVAVTATSRLAAAEETAQIVRALGRKSVALTLDQSKTEEIREVIESTVSSLGKLDILVNNAAAGVMKPAIEFAEDEWDLVLDTDLKGAFFCAQEAAKQMIRQGNGGRIVNVASVLGLQANYIATNLAYCAAKAGLINTTKVLAVEWAKYGITVNAVAPGYIETPLVKGRIQENPAFANKMLDRIPAKRMATPEEIALSVLYLASPAASYIIGHTLVIDGGWTAW